MGFYSNFVSDVFDITARPRDFDLL